MVKFRGKGVILMKRSDLLDMAGLNISCPICGKTVVYEVKSNSDFVVCPHCKKEFELSPEQKANRDAQLSVIL